MIGTPSRYVSPVAHGISSGADQVAAAQLGRIHAEPARAAVEEPVEHEGGLGPARAAVRGGEGLVGTMLRPVRAVVRHPVRPRQMIDRVERDGLAQRGRDAVIARELRLQGQDAAVARQAEARVVHLVAIGGGAEEVLVSRLHPLHGPTQAARHRGHEDVLGVDMPLDAEAAAHVGREHADALLGQAKHGGDGAAHRERHLGRRPHGELAADGIERRQHAAGLERHPGHARVREPRASTTTSARGEAGRGVAARRPCSRRRRCPATRRCTRGAPAAAAASAGDARRAAARSPPRRAPRRPRRGTRRWRPRRPRLADVSRARPGEHGVDDTQGPSARAPAAAPRRRARAGRPA